MAQTCSSPKCCLEGYLDKKKDLFYLKWKVIYSLWIAKLIVAFFYIPTAHMKTVPLAQSLHYAVLTLQIWTHTSWLLRRKLDDSMLIVCWKGDVEGVKQTSMVFGNWPGMRPLDLYLGRVSLNRACSCAWVGVWIPSLLAYKTKSLLNKQWLWVVLKYPIIFTTLFIC